MTQLTLPRMEIQDALPHITFKNRKVEGRVVLGYDKDGAHIVTYRNRTLFLRAAHCLGCVVFLGWPIIGPAVRHRLSEMRDRITASMDRDPRYHCVEHVGDALTVSVRAAEPGESSKVVWVVGKYTNLDDLRTVYDSKLAMIETINTLLGGEEDNENLKDR